MSESYIWDDEFQKVIIGLLLTDSYFMGQSMGLIEPAYFINEIHQQITRTLFNYFIEHKQQPSRVFIKQELIDFLRKKYSASDDSFEKAKIMYLTELETIYNSYSKDADHELYVTDSPEAILQKIIVFAKVQAMKGALSKTLDLLKKNPESDETYFKIDDFWHKARSVDRQQDLGLNYFEMVEERYNRMKIAGPEDVITSGFITIDNHLNAGGIRRGEIGAWMASGGVGKSLCLAHAAIRNMSKGKKVLFLSTEMNQDAVAQRFDSMISMIGKHELLLKEDIVKMALIDYVREYEDKRRLIIKQFPSGTADLNTIRAFHGQLKMRGFTPDLVIVDYLGDLKDATGLKTYESRYLMLRDLRGFGSIEGHATLTAIHPRRSQNEKTIEDVLDEDEIADSYNMFRVFDCLWSLNQTKHEKQAHVGRAWISKHRDGQSKMEFKIWYGYADQTLRIEEISQERYGIKMTSMKSKIADLVGEEVKKPKKKWKPNE